MSYVEINDGIVDDESYRNSLIKILWILKEANKDIECKDLREFLRERILLSYPRWKVTYASVIEVSYGILEGFRSNEFPKYKDIPDDGEQIDIFKQIAVININKLPGRSSNYRPKLKEAFNKFKEVILNQIEDFIPDIIIGGNTLSLLIEVAKMDTSNKYVYSYERNGQLWLDAYHPSLPRLPFGKRIKPPLNSERYYTSIINKVNEWKKKQKGV